MPEVFHSNIMVTDDCEYVIFFVLMNDVQCVDDIASMIDEEKLTSHVFFLRMH